MKTLISLLLATTLSVQASQSTIDTIEQAAMNLNSQQLTELANQYDGYEQGLAYYRLAISQYSQSLLKEANNSLDLAITVLETLTEEQTTHDEAWILLAQVYGLKTAYQPMKAPTYAIKANQAMKQGFDLNSSNPRAYLVKGISAYNTPAMFGGSKKSALKALDQAVELYAQDTSSFAWGNAEAYVWRGLTHLSTDNKNAALEDFQSAISIAPNYGWAQMLWHKNQ